MKVRGNIPAKRSIAMTIVDQMRHLNFEVKYDRSSGLWIANDIDLFREPAILSDTNLMSLATRIKQHVYVYISSKGGEQ